MTLGTGCNMHGHVGTSCRSRCLFLTMGLDSQHRRFQARSVTNALRFFGCVRLHCAWAVHVLRSGMHCRGLCNRRSNNALRFFKSPQTNESAATHHYEHDSTTIYDVSPSHAFTPAASQGMHWGNLHRGRGFLSADLVNRGL